MTIRNLHHALAPASVAVFGATERAGSVGAVVMRNILAGGFEGRVWPVNPKHRCVMGLDCLARAADLPEAPDLAVVVTPAATVPRLVAEIGARGCKTAVVITAGIGSAGGLRQAMLDAARPHLLRIIGPNTVGLIVPPVKLNASFAHMGAAPGNLALLSQSGAIATSLIDWAAERGIGFSQIVSLGDMADVDTGDYLDLLAGDAGTRAILVYCESIPQARKFLSAARAAARLKPVIAVKAGRSQQGARAAATHTGALSGGDAVVEAALHRAGVLRVRGLAELFAAAETVARFRPLDRARLGIVTNGGGAGVLAVDRLADGAGTLADLAPVTVERLGAALPGNWSRGNPVDIVGDAPPGRYLAAVEAVAADPGVDVLLVMNCPTGLAAPADAAKAVAGAVEKGMIGRKPVLSCWLGGPTAREARAILHGAGVPTYETPATAAEAVGHLTDWGRAQAALLRVPDRGTEAELKATPGDARAKAGAIFAAVAAEGRRMLTEPEAKAVIAAYGIPVPDLRVAATPDEVGRTAAEMLGAEGGELVVKILSRRISHKSDVGGVALGLDSAERAEAAARGMARRLARARSEAVPEGFVLQPMVRRPGAQELILGLARDPVFGPVILFGAGGIAVEVIRDTAVALPPLDATLAGDLVAGTRIGRLLAGYRGQPPADEVAVKGALIALSHIVEDFPCLRGLDVNPLLADAAGVIALDARMEIDPAEIHRTGPNPDLAIRPFPAAWRREVALKDGTYAIRPIRPADALLYPQFLEKLEAEDIRLRFLAPRRHFPEQMLVRLTQLDYDRDMAFVALAPDGTLAGVSRISCDPDHTTGEYALLVRSDLHGRGIGTTLMRILIDYARADGVRALEGMILSENAGMLDLMRRFGFDFTLEPEDPGVMMSRLSL
ncbi:MAG: bifunctional acetate--CoA ligase family protein/GNAT family N-acetyltransferase [Rhodovulum sp.]|nr:bifunctional acetate--CoA ligase family protein/GNAT family N-acetyltransferase [Rhodovulum sp.]